ncbi:hypothetical protein [Psychroserpens algicola]|uniref:hypothetical protein n=1 Tax=Psychroserpens algicola TaxID=1719034 RepID=UPI001953C7FE|nr:hypothetical protein [Psychroserpens algicola]
MKIFNYKILTSWFQFLRILGKRYDVIFYYPQHFNRTNGENPYFLDFIATCKTYKISYLLIEEPSIESQNPRNKKALAFDMFFLKIWILRKLIPARCFSNFEKREHLVGKIINLSSLGHFRAPVYITISNSMGGVLRGINKKARIFDYQHGIINSKQPGYFFNGEATQLMRCNTKEVLVHGLGFVKPFMLVDAPYYKGKVHPIGTSSIIKPKINRGPHILVAMQIIETENRSQAWFQEQVDLLHEQFVLLEKNKAYKNRIIFIKQHPRSLQRFDMSKLFQFPFVKPYDGSDESKSIGLHVTFFSTTAFEYAAKGIPSLFLFSDLIPEGKTIFEDEYQYPYKAIRTISDWLEKIEGSDSTEIDTIMTNWYQKFYAPYDENLFLKLVNQKCLKIL